MLWEKSRDLSGEKERRAGPLQSRIRREKGEAEAEQCGGQELG